MENQTRATTRSLSWILALLVAGCSGTPTASEQTAGAATVSGPGLSYQAPGDWISETPSSSMRQAQYRLSRVEGDSEDAELVVFFFQGQGGSVQANLDRWKGQFSRPDGGPAADTAQVQTLQSNGVPLTVLDISGTYASSTNPMQTDVRQKPGFRMIAAVAETAQGPWFFRLTGPARSVARWEAGFRGMLDTIRPK